MDDLISRQAAIAEFNCCELTPDGWIDVNYAIDFLERLPSAQPEKCEDCGNFNKARLVIPQPERKKGRWIEYVNSHCECPFCHKEWSFFENMTEWFNFCPNCGARLEGSDGFDPGRL